MAEGPIARTPDITICAKPVVAPIEAWFGAAELTYKNETPTRKI